MTRASDSSSSFLAEWVVTLSSLSTLAEESLSNCSIAYSTFSVNLKGQVKGKWPYYCIRFAMLPHNVELLRESGVTQSGCDVFVFGFHAQEFAEETINPQVFETGDWMKWAVPLSVIVVAWRLLLLGSADSAYLYYTGVMTASLWLLGFIVFAGSLRQVGIPRTLGTSVCVAIFAFLLHDMINFAAFVPGAATTLFAMLGLLAADSEEAVPSESRPAARRWWPVAAGAIAVATVLAMGLVPVARSAGRLAAAEQLAAYAPAGTLASHPANASFAAAAAADPLDPTPYERQARWLVATSALPNLLSEALPLASEALDRAIVRDPHHHKLRRMEAQLLTRWAEATGSAEIYAAAVGAAREALRLYPRNPEGMIALGDCLARLGVATGDPAPLREAVNQYEKTLELDESRPSWVGARRFSDGKVEQVKGKLTHAEEALAGLP